MSFRVLAGLLFAVLLGSPASAADDVLRFLPSDTRLVLTIRPPLLGESEKKKGLEVIRQLYLTQLAPELKKVDTLPISDVTSVVIAQPHAGTLGGVVVLSGKIDRTLMEKQLRAAAKESDGDLTIETVGSPAVAVYRRRLNDKQLLELFPALEMIPKLARKLVAPREVYAAALDDRTLFVSTTRVPMIRAIRARPAMTKPRTSDELTALLRKQNDKDVASFVMGEDALLPALALIVDQHTRETFEQFEHITTRVQPGKTVRITLVVAGKSDDLGATLAKTAEVTVANIRKVLPRQVKDEDQRKALDELFKSFRVSRKGATVTMTGQLSEADVQKLLRVPAAQKKP
jgi:hypothetical protein